MFIIESHRVVEVTYMPPEIAVRPVWVENHNTAFIDPTRMEIELFPNNFIE
ncbi:MAG: hypothetical protein LBE56_03920 [Tannerella sp.]|jgi:hypothetical protein|nr:hypothetical protein [Tannerella sp.]